MPDKNIFLLRITPADNPPVKDQINNLNDNWLKDNDLVQIEQLTPESKDGFCYVLFVGKPRPQ